MKPSPDSRDSGRTRRLMLLTTPPLVALAFLIYAFSGLHTAADASNTPVAAAPARAAVHAVPAAAPTNADEVPVLREHDAELLAYRPHGG